MVFKEFEGEGALPYLLIQTRDKYAKLHQGRWDTITTLDTLLYYSTHLNEDPFGVAIP